MKQTKKDKVDPIVFAVIKARVDGVLNEMSSTVLRTSRSPVINIGKDFTCSILNCDAKLLAMADSIPAHLLAMPSSLRYVVECFKNDVDPGDCFINNSPYHGSGHAADVGVYAPVFYQGELICWVGTVGHLTDIGCHLPTSENPEAKDVYEEGLHFPPLRIVKDYKEIPDIIRFIKANFRYPELWHGDFLAQVGSLFVGEREIIKLCEKYGADVVKQFQSELIDYGDRRMVEEIKKLPKGTWSTEALSEKVEPWAPEGLLLKLKMSIDPDKAIITYDLTEMPDQLPWGFNLCEACARGSVILGSMACLDPTIPLNGGVFRRFNILLREGAVAGIPRWPAATALATMDIADEVANMVLTLWEQVESGRGHAESGYNHAGIANVSGADFRRNNAPYGTICFMSISGGGASKGYDGWAGFLADCVMGNQILESVELSELKTPRIIWTVGIQEDSAGAGKWRGGPAIYHRIQPRHHTMLGIHEGFGHTDAPQGIAGGKAGCLADHWIEKHATHQKVQQLNNVGMFEVKEDEEWVCLANGGGGYGDPLERDPAAVRDDARDCVISVKAARNDYGVVLNTKPELYQVDYEATKKLREQLREERKTKKNGLIKRTRD